MNIESGHIIITVLVLIVLAMGWLFVLNTQELQEIKALQATAQTLPDPSTPSARPSITAPLSTLNPHAQAIGKMESEAGMRLSRIAELIIRDEGKRKRPYADTGGAPSIGVGRNLRDNGVSVSELQAIVNDIDYDVVLKETHVQNGRVRIGSLDLANRIFPNPLTEHDIGLLLTDDLNNVRREAVSVFGQSVWGSIDGVRKEAILDVVFNLGLPRFKQFVKFIGAVKSADWDTAAAELLKSEAADENPERYFRNYRVMRTGNAKYFELHATMDCGLRRRNRNPYISKHC